MAQNLEIALLMATLALKYLVAPLVLIGLLHWAGETTGLIRRE